MKSTWWVRLLALGAALVALGLVGCAQERPPINRVQANALDKSFFVGPKLNDDTDNPEFYVRGFVIDESAGQSGFSVGLYTGLDRIKWQITEDALIARKSYQIAIGQNNHGVPGNTPVNGTIVAKYKILSHFDIKRAYNPQTGEPLNIVEENTTDRPWYKRQYMRVDWSTNEVNDPMWTEMFFGKIFGDLTVEPLTYTVNDPTNVDAPHFEEKNGYFDITNKYYVAPSTTSIWGMQVPTCILVGLYTGTTTTDCNAQEATVRFSYQKVDPNHDFEPTENTKRKMDVIANFGGAGSSAEPGFAGGTTQCWDPQYFYSDACFHQYLSKLNFWKLSHERIGSCQQDSDCTKQGLPAGSTCMPDHTCTVACNSDADNNADGTADACANSVTHYTGHMGSQCDMYYHQCTLPVRDRVLQPQGYWLNQGTPAELLDPLDKNGKSTSQMLGADGKPAAADAPYQVPTFRGAMEDVVKSWNQLVTTSIAYGREAECRSTAEDGKVKDPAQARTDCHNKYFVTQGGKDVTQMISFGGWGIATPKALPNDGPAALVACHTPLRDYDYQPTCGKITTKTCNPNSSTNTCGADMGCNAEGHCAAVARLGDLRKNFIFYWPYDSDAQYGGVTGLFADPETGEEHGAVATVMGRSATRAAAVYRDWLQTAMGDLTVNDYTTGVPAFIYNKMLHNGFSPIGNVASKAGGDKVASAQQGAASTPASADQVSGTPANPDGTGTQIASPSARVGNLPTPLQKKDMLNIVNNRVSSIASNPAFLSDAQPRWDALASRLRGTTIEADLVDPHWAMEAIGANPSLPVSSPAVSTQMYPAGTSFSELDAASPLRGLDPGTVELWRAQIGRMLADRGICYTHDVTRIGSVNFQGLARWYEDEFDNMHLDSDVKKKDSTGLWLAGARDPGLVKKRGQIIYEDLWKQMAEGIAIHEFGHSLGMRHNFESSYNAINYMPQYWQLRTDEGAGAGACTDLNSQGVAKDPASCMGPRFKDPQTLDEEGLAGPDKTGRSQGRPGVSYFGNTSVMEYEQDYLSPGIGPYDFMYTEAVYGGVLETYDIDHTNQGGVAEADQSKFVANLALAPAEFRLESDAFIHYTQLARDMKVFQESYCRPATQTELKQGEWRVVHEKVCSQSPRDHFLWRDFIDDSADATYNVKPDTQLASTSTSATGTGWTFTAWRTNPKMPNADGHDHERWPYRYGETYSPGYLHTNYSDNGADPYEVVMNNEQEYDARYPVTYFRRQNKDYQYFDIPSRTAERYFERERSYHWILEGSGDMGDPDVTADYKKANEETFYFLTRAAMSPEPGPMAPTREADGSTVYDVPDPTNPFASPSQFDVALIDGRYIGEDYSSNLGGDWDYLSWITHAGFGIERGLAISALLDSRPTLYTISRQTFLDGRAVMKNFQTDADTRVALDRFVGGVLSEDWKDVAPWVSSSDPPSSSSTPVGNAPDGLPYRSLQTLDLLDNNVAASKESLPADAETVFPNIGFRTELQTVLWADLYSALNSDTTLMKKLAIYIQGIDFVDAIPPSQLESFTDPNTGITYLARKYGPDTLKINGDTVDAGIASRMLEHANMLLSTGHTAELQNYIGLIDAAHQIEKDLADESAWNTLINTFQ